MLNSSTLVRVFSIALIASGISMSLSGESSFIADSLILLGLTCDVSWSFYWWQPVATSQRKNISL